jgi:hypothetical protein
MLIDFLLRLQEAQRLEEGCGGLDAAEQKIQPGAADFLRIESLTERRHSI